MTKWSERVSALAGWLAVPVVLVAWLAFAIRETAMAALADVALGGAAVAAVGFALASTRLVLVWKRGGTLRRGVALVTAGAALSVLGLLVAFRFVPFAEEEVRFANGDVVLAGTVYQPRGEGPHPGVVLVHGSGPESRSPYAFYARYLARRGVAALAYDKRGVGESAGELYGGGYADYAEDAMAGVRLLAGRAGVDASRIGLLGFSEAEWVAPLAASRNTEAADSPEVAFVALVGASGVSPAEQVALEMAIRLRTKGHEGPAVERALALNERIAAFQRTGEGVDSLNDALRVARVEPWFSDADDFPERVRPAEEYDWLPWWRSVMDFDPLPAWERVRVPVLLLKGGRDDRSPAEPMRRRIVGALQRGGNDAVEVRLFPEADHMLLEWPRGEGTPPPAFAEGSLELLVEWIHLQPPR